MTPIHHTFAPLADRPHRRLARALLLRPGRWQRGPEQAQLQQELGAALGGNAFLFSSGREALLALLTSLKLTPGEEVIVQGYTCVVVPNAITAARMVPVYADIDRRTLNLDVDAVERAITPRTRAIVCQHTFGIPSDVERLRDLCDRRSLLLIEDCAHILPDDAGPSDVGRHGDFLLLSFGRDKAISGVTGGAIVCRNPDAAPGLRQKMDAATDLPRGTIMRYLLYPLLYGVAKPVYGSGFGKALLALSQQLGLLLPIVTRAEKNGTVPAATFHRLPNACAALALDGWKRRRALNDHRRQLTKLYLEACAAEGWPVLHGIRSDLPLQKFPIFVPNASGIRYALKRQNIHLHDGWTGCVVCPEDVNITEAQYTAGLDPVAEAVCEEILSLPTHPTMTLAQTRTLVAALRPFLSSARP